MSLITRSLGVDGPQVSAIGFGMMGLSAFYGSTQSDEERLEVLDHIYNAGERFWDSSDAYGDSEVLIGKWFQRNPEKRKDIILATKFGNLGGGRAKNDQPFIHESCAKSLLRLQTDYIDLYYVHQVDPAIPIEKTVRAMVELKGQGKIRHLGLSEVSEMTLRRAHAIHQISAIQMEYSPFALEIERPETSLLRTCQELGVAVVAYSPLGRGLLSGFIRSRDDLEEGDFRKNVPRFSVENFPKNLRLVDEIQAIASRKGCTSSQLVLAWLLKQNDCIIPIPGTKKIKYFDENMSALDVKLTNEEVQEVRTAVDVAGSYGERYPLGWSRTTLFADTVPLQE